MKERERKKKGGKSSVSLVLFVSPTQGRCFAGRLLEPPPPLLQLQRPLLRHAVRTTMKTTNTRTALPRSVPRRSGEGASPSVQLCSSRPSRGRSSSASRVTSGPLRLLRVSLRARAVLRRLESARSRACLKRIRTLTGRQFALDFSQPNRSNSFLLVDLGVVGVCQRPRRPVGALLALGVDDPLQLRPFRFRVAEREEVQHPVGRGTGPRDEREAREEGGEEKVR